MVFLFFTLTLAHIAILWRLRKVALSLIAVTVLGALLMFWHHATDTLLIRW